jgi:hypothetical protein
MATQIAAPFQHMVTSLTAACLAQGYKPSNDVNGFPPKLPCKVPVSRSTFSDSSQLNTGVALLTLSYTDPAFAACPAVSAWLTPAGRVQALKPIQAWAASKGFTALNPLSYAAQTLLLKVLEDPTGSRPGSRMTEVSAAAAEVVRVSKTSFFDATLWVPLWTWAVGGPAGSASVRTRVFAMKAIQAILARGTLLPGQIRAADSLAAVLNNIVQTGAPAVPANERDLYRSEASATVGAAAQALVAAEMAAAAGLPMPGPTASVSAAPWVPIALGVGAVGLLIGGAVLVTRRRQAAIAA